MKRFRLIAACLSCVLCLSVLVVSVYAAVNAISFNLSASLIFEPNNCYVEINGDVSGEGTSGHEPFYTLTDGTNPYPEWNIERLVLLNEISLNFTFTNYSNFPIKITISGVSSGTNYTATATETELVINAYQQGETPYSDNLTITYKLIDQAESVNLTNLNIAISIEETTPTPPEDATNLERYIFYHPDATLPTGLTFDVVGDTLTEIITNLGFSAGTRTRIQRLESEIGVFTQAQIEGVTAMLIEMMSFMKSKRIGAGTALSEFIGFDEILMRLESSINNVCQILGIKLHVSSDGQAVLIEGSKGTSLYTGNGFFLLTDL